MQASALPLPECYGFQIYDAAIAACALMAGCTTLYAEDMRDGQQIAGLVMENPLRASALPSHQAASQQTTAGVVGQSKAWERQR